MKLSSLALGLGVIFAVSAAQQLPDNEAAYRIAELNPFNPAASMAVRDQDGDVIVRNGPTPNDPSSQQWVIKDLNTQDNTTALWNIKKQKFAGYTGTPQFDTRIVLLDTPTRFQLVWRRRAGFFIAVPGASNNNDRLTMVRGPLGSENRVILRTLNTNNNVFQTWNPTTPP